ncbi:MAG: sigma-54 dependent transcriptional regulator [Cyclobacteriaceae bacterium]|nr:sigma-54-dependent Fis family transcriptional regulator [Cyclobacteriaceae bacterium]MCH8515067.1 sigma-54 dependent transcriptional regulator [Cyclobacteriaceae bacterium]
MKSPESVKIFIVEDDEWYGELLKHHLSNNPDYSVELYDTGNKLLDQLHRGPDIICMDFGLPDYNGEKLLREIKSRGPNLPVIVISGQEDISTAVKLLKNGASDYIVKDEHTRDLLWRSVLNIIEKMSLRQEVEALKDQLQNKYEFDSSIIGQSTAIKSTLKLLKKATESTINISLTGETGTGKEVFAKAIHYNSDRSRHPFIALNMGAVPADLAESELFGHEKGAFTGAAGMKKGKFEMADGGTLFLDEVAEMDLSLQTKLLRVVQEREVTRIGSSKPISFNVRIITATHKDLSEEVKNGNFREDLYFRIMGLPIHLPPLRERGNDIVLLARHFIREYEIDNKINYKLELEAEAIEKLKSYNFPGNVRELKAVIDLACVMSDSSVITASDINFHELNRKNLFVTEEKSLREYNNDIISYYLEKYNHNVILVAEKLKIGKSTIYNLMKSGEIKQS